MVISVRTSLASLAAVIVATLSACGHKTELPAGHADVGSGASAADVASLSFAERRAQHRTNLVTHGPSPQRYVDEPAPPGVEEIRYRSGDLDLKAWYAHPTSGRVPALVYFHGGFAFGADDFNVVRPFLDAGFAVLTPVLRGENGNPGDFELYYGELDDARAAVAWIRGRPDVDRDHVFAFGHSAGGVLAALISFYPDTGLRLTGSAGGLYDTEVLTGLERFDPWDREESLLRVPAPNADQFRVPHIGYVGTDDILARRGATIAARIATKARSPLTVETVPGNHFASLEPALQRFLVRVQQSLAHH
jgi:acetyl esterase/lipase